jgi:phosphodiesterase/alkaline phosphatase D-like protein
MGAPGASATDQGTTQLVLGPLVRFVGDTSATVWIEADRACEVEVLGHRARTFQVAGHHYALLTITGLEPGTSYEYAVVLDGEQRWPDLTSPFPGSRIQTPDPSRGVKLVFGSCRVAAPHEGPYALQRNEHRLGLGVDALVALALRLRAQDPAEWPTLLLMVGDQVYADHASPQTRAFIRSRRSTGKPPGEEVADFEEYTQLYREAWSDRDIRWLLSTVPSAMVFDDHEVIDDWNISASWQQDMRAQPWWDERIAGAFMSYWIYQHLGNLSPEDLERDELYARVRTLEDAEPVLREFALTAAGPATGTRWSYRRDLGRSRLVVIDSRASRLLDGVRREMLDDEQWRWVDGELQGDVDHLLVATSLPFLLPQSIHDVESWNEAVCSGAWGASAARLSERLRRAIDLEHWAAFRSSFDRLARTLRDVAAGRRGDAPGSIVVLSGDVHYSYLAEAAFPRELVQSRVYQAVCSPFRHPLDPPLRFASRFAFSRIAKWIGLVLAHTVRLPPPQISWRMKDGPHFTNDVATLELLGREARIRLEHTAEDQVRLDCVADESLT